jgi:hypothetical protein
MDIEKVLRQLKAIQPDKDYAASSRRAILSTERVARVPFGAVRFIFSNLQSAGAIALTGVLIILMVGAFSVFRFLNPFRISSLDPAGLRAEAQAVDMQIQVANLTYQESTAPFAAAQKVPAILKKTTAGNQAATSTSSSTLPISVDDALDMLSQ